MENIKSIVVEKLDLSLPYWTMYEKFLTDWETDEELETILKDITAEDIMNIFLEIHKEYYFRDTQIENKETNVKQDECSYNKHNLVVAKNEKDEVIIFNATIGISMSKTSYQKYLKNYTNDDIDRIRLFCLFNNHSRPDDDFVKKLFESGIRWKQIMVKNPKRIYSRFKQISI